MTEVQFTIALSGTFPSNRVGELYPFFWRIGSPITQGITYENFVRKYAKQVRETKFGLTHKGVKNVPEIQAAMKTLYIRRTVDDVAKDIPGGTIDHIPLEIPKELEQEEKALLTIVLGLAEYGKKESELIAEDLEYLQAIVECIPDFTALSDFRRKMGFIKIPLAMKYFEETVLPECKKFIIFCHHLDVAADYFRLLSKKVTTNLVTGQNTSQTNRFEILKEINAAPEGVLICTMQAVETGYDLTGFTRSFFVEQEWRISTIKQCMGRTRRIGQNKPTFWTFLAFERGLDSLMHKRITQKEQDINAIRGINVSGK